jgi:hypothetical protein
MGTASVEEIQERLRTWARRHAAPVSPLYGHLGAHAADDPDVAALLTAAGRELGDPTLLFAAVHRVLAADPFHELTNYYPSLGGSYGVDAAVWPMWREFVLARAARVRELVATRATQTNEVRRAAALYPAVALAAREAAGPIGLLEVGASAGLLLGLDMYGYRYQTEEAGQIAAGPPRAAVTLHSALRLAPGAVPPPIPKRLTVETRLGLDPRPVDLADEEQLAWLEACVWPDQPERLRLLGAAAAAQRKNPPDLVPGDAVADLAAAAARIPPSLPLVVLTSVVLWYFDDARRMAFLAALDDLARDRPLWWVSLEDYRRGIEPLLPGRTDLDPPPNGPAFGVVGLVRWPDGIPTATALARTAMHGERLEWLP